MERRLHRDEVQPPGNLHSVKIAWTASTSPVVGYYVYRSNPYGYRVEKLTPEPISATQFTDTAAVGGEIYNYYATSVNAKGFQSNPSNTTTVAIPYP